MGTRRWAAAIGAFILGAPAASAAQSISGQAFGELSSIISVAVGALVAGLGHSFMWRVMGPERYSTEPYPGFRRLRQDGGAPTSAPVEHSEVSREGRY